MRISDWSSDVCSSDLLPALAATVKAIGAEGTEGFYRGALAKKIAADLAVIGSPVAAADLARHQARRVAPLSVGIRSAGGATLYNFPPPTQGLSSLMIQIGRAHV